MHIIEIGEPMEIAVKRLIDSGIPVEDIKIKTMLPEDFISDILPKIIQPPN